MLLCCGLEELPADADVAFWLKVLLSDAVVVIVASGGTNPSDAVGVASLAVVVCSPKVFGYNA